MTQAVHRRAEGRPPPTVSIVIPTRDRASSLSRAIASVRAQTVTEWELLVVDDGSTDDTPERVASLAEEDHRLRLVRRKASGGAAAARNEGAAHARAALLAFLDDDAEWLPPKLERQLAALDSEPASGLVYCPTELVGPGGARRMVGSPAAAGPNPSRALLCGNDIDTSAVVVRRALFEAVGGFDERLPRLQDWDLWLRLGERTGFVFVDAPLARSHFTAGSISTRSDALVEASRMLADKFEARTRRDAAGAAAGWYALGHALMIGGAPAEGRRMLARAVRARPSHVRRWIMTALAWIGTRPYLWASRMHERRTPPPQPGSAGR